LQIQQRTRWTHRFLITLFVFYLSSATINGHHAFPAQRLRHQPCTSMTCLRKHPVNMHRYIVRLYHHLFGLRSLNISHR
jgi:hypothetical protein